MSTPFGLQKVDQRYLPSNDFVNSLPSRIEIEYIGEIIKLRLSIALLGFRGLIRTTIIYRLPPTLVVRGR